MALDKKLTFAMKKLYPPKLSPREKNEGGRYTPKVTPLKKFYPHVSFSRYFPQKSYSPLNVLSWKETPGSTVPFSRYTPLKYPHWNGFTSLSRYEILAYFAPKIKILWTVVQCFMSVMTVCKFISAWDTQIFQNSVTQKLCIGSKN